MRRVKNDTLVPIALQSHGFPWFANMRICALHGLAVSPPEGGGMTCGQYCCIRLPLSKYSHTSIYVNLHQHGCQYRKTSVLHPIAAAQKYQNVGFLIATFCMSKIASICGICNPIFINFPRLPEKAPTVLPASRSFQKVYLLIGQNKKQKWRSAGSSTFFTE